ncbi:unnamed protein product [Brachionus calyciflorus]|uniref:FLYWCH-type domain-containing protein n=1 Tax=Brachionus calyciflorus TaxID=104777 RepID=A0A813M3N2_9BILA|nr:unnamed protein product [Brachionus calyciflorus]
MFDINQLSDDLNKLSMENKCGQVTMSQKQKPLLCLNNYFYRISTKNNGNVFWRCTVTGCNVRCTTFGDTIGQKYAVNINDSFIHCHAPDTTKFANLEKRRFIKEKASVSDEPARKIISQNTGRGRGVKYSTIHRKPKYLIELWSIHKRLIDDIPRTTNYCESWHNAFGNMLKKHPNVYCLIDSLRHENKNKMFEL